MKRGHPNTTESDAEMQPAHVLRRLDKLTDAQQYEVYRTVYPALSPDEREAEGRAKGIEKYTEFVKPRLQQVIQQDLDDLNPLQLHDVFSTLHSTGGRMHQRTPEDIWGRGKDTLKRRAEIKTPEFKKKLIEAVTSPKEIPDSIAERLAHALLPSAISPPALGNEVGPHTVAGHGDVAVAGGPRTVARHGNVAMGEPPDGGDVAGAEGRPPRNIDSSLSSPEAMRPEPPRQVRPKQRSRGRHEGQTRKRSESRYGGRQTANRILGVDMQRDYYNDTVIPTLIQPIWEELKGRMGFDQSLNTFLSRPANWDYLRRYFWDRDQQVFRLPVPEDREFPRISPIDNEKRFKILEVHPQRVFPERLMRTINGDDEWVVSQFLPRMERLRGLNRPNTPQHIHQVDWATVIGSVKPEFWDNWLDAFELPLDNFEEAVKIQRISDAHPMLEQADQRRRERSIDPVPAPPPPPPPPAPAPVPPTQPSPISGGSPMDTDTPQAGSPPQAIGGPDGDDDGPMDVDREPDGAPNQNNLPLAMYKSHQGYFMNSFYKFYQRPVTKHLDFNPIQSSHDIRSRIKQANKHTLLDTRANPSKFRSMAYIV